MIGTGFCCWPVVMSSLWSHLRANRAKEEAPASTWLPPIVTSRDFAPMRPMYHSRSGSNSGMATPRAPDFLAPARDTRSAGVLSSPDVVKRVVEVRSYQSADQPSEVGSAGEPAERIDILAEAEPSCRL